MYLFIAKTPYYQQIISTILLDHLLLLALQQNNFARTLTHQIQITLPLILILSILSFMLNHLNYILIPFLIYITSSFTTVLCSNFLFLDWNLLLFLLQTALNIIILLYYFLFFFFYKNIFHTSFLLQIALFLTNNMMCLHLLILSFFISER